VDHAVVSVGSGGGGGGGDNGGGDDDAPGSAPEKRETMLASP
jgi:hypothetical protein